MHDPLSIKVSRVRTFLGLEKTAVIDCSLDFPPPAPESELPTAALTSAFINHLSGTLHEVFEVDSRGGIREPLVVDDIRGRPRESFAGSPAAPAEGEEEIFFSSGVVDTEAPSDGSAKTSTRHVVPNAAALLDPESEIEIEETPFTLRLLSKFHTFKGRSSIQHRLRLESSGAINEFVGKMPLDQILQQIPVHVEQIRLGFETFKPRFGSMIGLSPVIQNRFYLEISNERMKLHAQKDTWSSGQVAPFLDDEPFIALDQSLEQTALYTGFLSRVKDALAQR